MMETIEQAHEAIGKVEQGYIVSILSSGDASLYDIAQECFMKHYIF